MSVTSRVLRYVASSGRTAGWMSHNPALAGRLQPRLSRYVAGSTVDEAVTCVRTLSERGLSSAVIRIGEAVTEPAEVEAIAAEYRALAARLGELPAGPYLACDLSNLGLDISRAFCLQQIVAITGAMPAGSRLEVSAENDARCDPAMDVLSQAMGAGADLVVTVRANLERSQDDARRYVALGAVVRVVKGAYQERGTLPRGPRTDDAFEHLVATIQGNGGQVIAATHDDVLLRRLHTTYPALSVEMLFGVRADLAQEMRAAGLPVRIEVPYGPEWFRFGLRRLAEAQATKRSSQ